MVAVNSVPNVFVPPLIPMYVEPFAVAFNIIIYSTKMGRVDVVVFVNTPDEYIIPVLPLL